MTVDNLMTEAEQFACKECDRHVLKSPTDGLAASDYWKCSGDPSRPSRHSSFKTLQAAKLCQVCWDHQEGMHLTSFKSNCMECQVAKKQFAKKLKARLEEQESHSVDGPNHGVLNK